MNQGLRLSEQRIRNNRIRRRRELRRRQRAGVLMLFFTALFLSTFFSLRIRAEGNKENNGCQALPAILMFNNKDSAPDALSQEDLSKYYTSIQVKSGDTLWGYACEYGHKQYYKNNKEYIEEVIAINSLKGDTITAGQHLILPYYRSAYTPVNRSSGSSSSSAYT